MYSSTLEIYIIYKFYHFKIKNDHHQNSNQFILVLVITKKHSFCSPQSTFQNITFQQQTPPDKNMFTYPI